MIAAGVTAKALSTHVGHARIGITLEGNTQLRSGNEHQAGGTLDGHLTRWPPISRRSGTDPARSDRIQPEPIPHG